jgi:hypothetical protein
MQARVDPVVAIMNERKDIQARVSARLSLVKVMQESSGQPAPDGFLDMAGALTAGLTHLTLEGLRQVAAALNV